MTRSGVGTTARTTRPIWVAVLALAAVVVTGVALLVAPAAAAGSVAATFTARSPWQNGYTGAFTVSNGTDATVESWRVEFDLPDGTAVGTFWDALHTVEDTHHTFVNRSHNGTIAPGGTVTFGFVANGTGLPSDCTVNGSPCHGADPPTDPTDPPIDPPTDPPVDPPGGEAELPDRVLVGYLHASFANGSGYVRMADVPDEWDVINLAFGEPTSPTSGDIRFERCPRSQCPNVESEAEFVESVDALQAQGRKVLISIGGANGQVRLVNRAARDAFVRSVSAIIDRYGLDGLDIDFEGHSLSLNAGDRDFRNPTTPVIVNLISALNELTARYGDDFVLTMAPETFFVQLGYQFYGRGEFGGADPRAGAYLPVIHAMRDDLTLLHVQDYNSGPIMGLDDQFHFMGNADFHVAMTDMLLAGFPVEGDPDNVFPPLRPDQVAIGLPASVHAGNGFTPVGEVHQALDCLTTGRNCGSYQPRGGVNRDLRGLMTWSINWDRFNDFEFSRNHRAYLDAL